MNTVNTNNTIHTIPYDIPFLGINDDNQFLKPPRFYIPSNLDLKREIEKLEEPERERWSRHQWRLEYVITVVFRARWNKKYSSEHFVPLSGVALQEAIGSHFQGDAVRLLTKWGILQCDNHYIKVKNGNGKAKGYRFCRKYRDSKFRAIKVDLSLVPVELWSFRIAESTCPEDDFIKKNLNLLMIDDSVEEFLEEHKQKTKGKIRALKHAITKMGILQDDLVPDLAETTSKWINELVFPLKSKLRYLEQSIIDIRNQDFMFSPGKKSKRIFTTVTNSPKVIRRFFRFKGCPLIPLVEIDVACCQFLLLFGIYEGSSEAERLEMEKFKDIVQKGTFYEFLDERLEKPYGTANRGRLKEVCFTQILFDENRKNPGSVFDIFQKEFPILTERIKKKKEHDSGALAVELQSLEAEIIIFGVLARIMKKSSPFFVLSIHDSLLVLPQHVAEAKQMMEEEFIKRLGFKPLIKDKNFATIEEIKPISPLNGEPLASAA
jgi:hypothetical protein